MNRKSWDYYSAGYRTHRSSRSVTFFLFFFFSLLILLNHWRYTRTRFSPICQVIRLWLWAFLIILNLWIQCKAHVVRWNEWIVSLTKIKCLGANINFPRGQDCKFCDIKVTSTDTGLIKPARILSLLSLPSTETVKI